MSAQFLGDSAIINASTKRYGDKLFYLSILIAVILAIVVKTAWPLIIAVAGFIGGAMVNNRELARIKADVAARRQV